MKRKVYVNILTLLLVGAILSVGFVAYSKTDTKETAQKTANLGNKSLPEVGKAISQDANNAVIRREPKKDVDISGIKIAGEVEESVRTLDAANAEKNIYNCKMLISELNISEQYQGEIGRQVMGKKNVPDVLIAYKFLSENYGTVNELEDMISEKKAGKTFAQLFKDYNETHTEFVPTNFKEGYLEGLLKTPGITADDIMIADRLSQKGFKTFEEFIELKKQRITWKDINTVLGVINTSESFPHVSITELQIKKQVDRSGLSEQQVMEALVIAGRLEEDATKIADKIKAGKMKEDIFAEAYEEKYR